VWASDITYPRLLLAGAGIRVPCSDNRLV